MFNTTVSITTTIFDQEVIKLGISTISYIMICPDSYKTQQSLYKSFLTKNKNLLFLYKGNKSCGYKTIEASVFFKRHKVFALILIISALVTFASLAPLQNIPIIYRLSNPNMSIAGSTFSLGILTSISFMSNFEHYMPLSYQENMSILTTFYLCVILQSLLLAYISFYSPFTVAPLHSISIGLVLSYVCSTLYLLIFGNGVSESCFHAMIFTISLLSASLLAFLAKEGSDKLLGKRRRLLKNSKRQANLNNKKHTKTNTENKNTENIDDSPLQINSSGKKNSLKENLSQKKKRITTTLRNRKSNYTIGALIVGFCTPFYLFFGFGCYFSWWPEIITRQIEQSYGISKGAARDDYFAWWGLLGIMAMQVVGIFSGLDLLD